jgi:hypothetical protein
MTFPINMDDLGSLVGTLRGEGFDARTDIFNGQVGLIVGPRGLDEKRIPPNTAALFFPLWELNYVPNRPLLEARRFHDVFESRPSDWQPNRPYQNQPEHDRINLRHWNRSASLLGGGKLEEAIQKELIRRFPPNEFPVNIDVVGGQAQTYATVQITNFYVGIDEKRKAIPEDYLGRGETMAAVLDAAEQIIRKLQGTGRIPAAPQRQTTHAGLKLSLRRIAHIGDGPDIKNWKQVTQYEVQGLPIGERAWIANFGAPNRHNWRILRATNEVQSDWTGDYGSAQEALETLTV